MHVVQNKSALQYPSPNQWLVDSETEEPGRFQPRFRGADVTGINARQIVARAAGAHGAILGEECAIDAQSYKVPRWTNDSSRLFTYAAQKGLPGYRFIIDDIKGSRTTVADCSWF
jgi:hypothetical protein